MRMRFVLYRLAALISLSGVTAIAQENDGAAIRDAVKKSLSLLQTSGRTFIKNSGCVSCHHQSLPGMALALARTRGFTVDEEMAREQVQATIAAWSPQRETLFQGIANGVVGVSEVFTAGYSLLELAAANVPPNATTDAMAHYIARKQLSDGRFRMVNAMRPPLEYSDFTTTALGLRALQLYAQPGLKKVALEQVGRARRWLLSAVPTATEEKSFQLQGLAWADADKGEIARRVATLVAEQRSDGGWPQLSTLSSDAYATGQVLVALQQAGGVSRTSAVYRNGIKFLLKTQLDDGSWHVISRGRGTQPYFETGFPHGADQFISAAGSAWATAALVLYLEPVNARPVKVTASQSY